MAQKLYILNDRDNPVKKYRLELKLSRLALAKLADVTNSVIVRAELGLLNSLPPAIARALSHELGKGKEDEIHMDWDGWQFERRQEIGEIIRESIPQGGRLFKSQFTENYFRQIAYEINGSSTDYNVARVFSLHPVTWTQYVERGGGQAFDSVLNECVEDIIYGVNNE